MFLGGGTGTGLEAFGVAAPGAGVVVPPSTVVASSAIISSKSARASEKDRIEGLAAPALPLAPWPTLCEGVNPRDPVALPRAEDEDNVACKLVLSPGVYAFDGVACCPSSIPPLDCPEDIAAPSSVTSGPGCQYYRSFASFRL
jgi:hypothetical protein